MSNWSRNLPPAQAIVDAALEVLDPSCDYGSWFNAAAAIHTMTKGSEEGLEAFDRWSAQSSKYPNRRRIEYMWQSLGRYRGERRLGMATLRRLVEAEGASWSWVLASANHDSRGGGGGC
jgi:hypothetical protein